MSVMAYRSGAALFLGVLVSSGTAMADSQLHAWLDYRQAEGCPGEYTFRAQVQARTANLVLIPVSPGSPPLEQQRTYIVRLQREEGSYRGTLDVIALPAPPAHNALVAPTCDEVVAGLALAAALGADRPEGSSTPTPAPLPPAATRPASGPPSVVTSPASNQDAVSIAPRGGVFQSSFGFFADARLGYGPSIAPGVGLSLAHRSRSGVAWHAEIAGFRAGEAEQAHDSATFWGLTGEVEVCPVLVASAAVMPLACASLEAGALAAAAASGETSLRPWTASGLALRLFVPVGRSFFEPSLAGRLPLVRDHYWVRPDSSLFQTPVVVGQLAISFGFPF